MKAMTRDFTKREKVLLAILLIIILALLYYIMVYEPVSDGIKNAESEIGMLEDQLVIADAKVAQMQKMQQEMDAIESAGGNASYMPSYNASKVEIDFLNGTLATTKDYYVGFTGITREGEQIRRDFSLQYLASDYAGAVNIIRALENSDIRCLVRDFTIAPAQNTETLSTGEVQVNCVATFFETMHDGIEDQELPPDTAPKESESTENE